MELIDAFKSIKIYLHSITCSNCGFNMLVQIPKGIKVKDFKIKKTKCIHCGC
jgi:ribosomal protein L37E